MTSLRAHLRAAAREHIQRALREHDTVGAAARALGVNPKHIYKLMHKLGIKPNRQNSGNAAWRALSSDYPRHFNF